MKDVKIYTWTVCPYCQRAKDLLRRKGVNYTEVNLDGNDEEFAKLQTRSGMKTVPQIFIGDELVGGFRELSALEIAGELDAKLKS